MRSISHKCGNFCSSSQDVLSLLWPEMIFLEKLKRWSPTANLVATSPSDVARASTTTVQPKKSAQFSGKPEQIMTQLESLNVNIKFFEDLSWRFLDFIFMASLCSHVLMILSVEYYMTISAYQLEIFLNSIRISF